MEKGTKKQKRNLANVFLLGTVSFLNDISSEMILPVLPFFIVSLGGGGFVIGLVSGLRDGLASTLKVFSGWLSDRTGKRKPFIYSGYSISALFKFLLAFSKNWWHILIFASSERVGKGLRTAPRDAIVSQSMVGQEGRGFGIHRMMDTSGAVLGSVLAFFLFWYYGLSFKAIILFASFIAFFSLLPLPFVKERKEKASPASLKISLKNLPSSLKLFIFVAGIFSLANFSYMFFLLRAKDVFASFGNVPLFSKLVHPSIAFPLLFYIVFNIFYAGSSYFFGWLADKIGTIKVIFFGYLLFAFLSLGFVFLRSFLSFLFLFSLYGLVWAAIDGNQRALVSDLSPVERRATALGAFHTVVGLAAFFSGLIAGFLWQKISPPIMFSYGAFLASLSAFLVFIFRKRFSRI